MLPKLVKSFLFVSSFTGLVYQLYGVVQLYLSYQTINQIRLRYAPHIQLPKLVVCHPFTEHVNKTVKRAFEEQFKKNTLTTQFVLDNQPPSRNFFDWCNIHNSNTTGPTEYNCWV